MIVFLILYNVFWCIDLNTLKQNNQILTIKKIIIIILPVIIRIKQYKQYKQYTELIHK